MMGFTMVPDTVPARHKGKFVEKENDGLPWVEKYRPKELGDLIAHTDIIDTITRFIDQNRLPHLLFYGPPGTGKTSTILACAEKLYGNKKNNMVLELNASDERGIDVVREQIKNFASSQSIFSSGYKMIILDEADAMTQVAQNALRRVIEKYTKNVRFCMICNYVGKIIPALQSRCTKFRFAPLQETHIRSRLEYIVEKEHVKITQDGKQALYRLCQGDMRRVLNILQATHAAHDIVNEAAIYECAGAPLPSDIKRILDWLMKLDFSNGYSNIYQLKQEKGLALVDILREVHDLLAVMELPKLMRVHLLEQMADIEYRLASATSEKIQLGSLIGAFRTALELA